MLVNVVETEAHEGPVYSADEDALYFTTRTEVKRVQLDGTCFPRDPIGDVSVVSREVVAPNGMVVDDGGTLLVCEQGNLDRPARIVRLDPRTGAVTPVVDAAASTPLNSPNDVIVASDGAIWFTDPSYGFLQGFRSPPARRDAVYRFDRGSGVLTAAVTTMCKPNGLALSPDEQTLYVGDSGANTDQQRGGRFRPDWPHCVLAFAVHDGAVIGEPSLFATIAHGEPDGLKVDREGNVFVSSARGVEVYDASGRPLRTIELPGAVNFAFGLDERVLFITADTAVWAYINKEG